MLDEPAAGSDAESRAAFFGDLEHALSDRAATVVHVSHEAEEVLRVADRVVVLVKGGVRQIDTPELVNRRPADASVASLVGYHNVVDAFVEPDGRVLVDRASTGPVCRCPTGRATVAVLANGVRLLEPSQPGLTVRGIRVRPDRGHVAVAVDDVVPLLIHVPDDVSALSGGDVAHAVFGPALTAVLPPAQGDGPAIRDGGAVFHLRTRALHWTVSDVDPSTFDPGGPTA